VVDRTKELRTIARRATGHAGMLRNLQMLSNAGDEEVSEELSSRLADDLRDYVPGCLPKQRTK